MCVFGGARGVCIWCVSRRRSPVLLWWSSCCVLLLLLLVLPPQLVLMQLLSLTSPMSLSLRYVAFIRCAIVVDAGAFGDRRRY